MGASEELYRTASDAKRMEIFKLPDGAADHSVWKEALYYQEFAKAPRELRAQIASEQVTS